MCFRVRMRLLCTNELCGSGLCSQIAMALEFCDWRSLSPRTQLQGGLTTASSGHWHGYHQWPLLRLPASTGNDAALCVSESCGPLFATSRRMHAGPRRPKPSRAGLRSPVTLPSALHSALKSLGASWVALWGTRSAYLWSGSVPLTSLSHFPQ